MKHNFVTAALGLLLAASAVAQQAPRPPGMPAFDPKIVRMLDEFNATMEKAPDLPGTGMYPAVKLVDPSLPHHVIYRPADLSRVPAKGLGIVIWGNGGCANDGASGRRQLEEIASHGYLAVAPGPIMSGPGSPPPDQRPKGAQTLWTDVTAGLDAALAANADTHHPLYGKLDPDKIAVAGHSCGGLQALNVALHDPRVKTALIFNSGIFNAPVPGRVLAGAPTKDDLARIKVPVIYILGGPDDMAYANGVDDYRHINGVPVVMATHQLGHQGTFAEPNGGMVASVAVDWLDWQLRGDKNAAKRFVGPTCGLCTDPRWTVERKNL